MEPEERNKVIWTVVMIFATLVFGFAAGALYVYNDAISDITNQANVYMDKHCYCYENKPADNMIWQTPDGDWQNE